MKNKTAAICLSALISATCLVSFPACVFDFKFGASYTDDLITALGNTMGTEMSFVAFDYDMDLNISVEMDGKKQAVGLTLTSVGNTETQEADFFLKTSLTENGVKDTMAQDMYLREGVVLSTDAYMVGEDVSGAALTATDMDNVLEEAFSENFGSTIDIDEIMDVENLRSLLYFAEEYKGLTKKLDVYEFDANKVIYNVAKDLRPVLKKLNSKTTFGDLVKTKAIKRLIGALTQEKTIKELREENESYNLIFGYMIGVKEEDMDKTAYEYLVDVLKRETSFAGYTGTGTPLYDTTVERVLLATSNQTAEEFADELMDLFGDDIQEDSMELSFEYEGVEMSIALEDFTASYTVKNDQITAEEMNMEMEISMDEQKAELDFSIAAKLCENKKTLTDLSSRQVKMEETITEYYNNKESSTTALFIAPETLSWAYIDMEGTVATNVSFVDDDDYYYGASANILTTYDSANDVYRYEVNGNSMYAKVTQSGYYVHLYIYCADGTLFNSYSIYRYYDAYTETLMVTYEEFFNKHAENENENENAYLVEGGLSFTYLEESDSYSVAGFAGEGVENLVIPSTVNGKPVTEIGISAFEDNYTICSVVIPDSVQIVRSHAFEYCQNLKTVEARAQILETYAFKSCFQLKTLKLEGVKVLNRAFIDCYMIQEVTLDTDVIGFNSFQFGNMQIQSFTYKGTVEQWRALHKGESWQAGVYCDEITCLDGTVSSQK